MPPWNAAKAKVQLRISVQRLRTLQQKKEAQAKASRRDIATVLEQGRIERSRIKVESLINEDIHIELLELLELYCELLLARFGLLDQNTPHPDPAIHEAICAVIFSAPSTELKELHILRDLLMHKYGRDFTLSVMENKDGVVSDRVVKKLLVKTPPPELVDAFLHEIAKAYSVNWAPVPPPSNGEAAAETNDQDKLKIANADTPDEKEVSPAEETPLKLPDLPPTESKEDVSKGAKASSPPADDFEALAKRFNDLKRR